MLWNDLKITAHTRHPNWSSAVRKNDPKLLLNFVSLCQKHLFEVISAKTKKKDLTRCKCKPSHAFSNSTMDGFLAIVYIIAQKNNHKLILNLHDPTSKTSSLTISLAHHLSHDKLKHNFCPGGNRKNVWEWLSLSYKYVPSYQHCMFEKDLSSQFRFCLLPLTFFSLCRMLNYLIVSIPWGSDRNPMTYRFLEKLSASIYNVFHQPVVHSSHHLFLLEMEQGIC